MNDIVNSIRGIRQNSFKDKDRLIQTIEEMDRHIVGMKTVKDQIINYLALWIMKIRTNRITEETMMHGIITGNPGVGKTTVCKYMSRIFYYLGILREHIQTKGKKRELFNIYSRGDFIGDVIGATTTKTKKLLTDSLGSVVFIDEAYSLVSGSGHEDYGPEALAIINQMMSEVPSSLIVIFAGYKKQMEILEECQKGLTRRIAWRIDVPDYDTETLSKIMVSMLRCRKWSVVGGRKRKLDEDELEERCKDMLHGKNLLGNAGDIQTTIDKAEIRYALREYKKKRMTKSLNIDDLEKGMNEVVEKSKSVSNDSWKLMYI